MLISLHFQQISYYISCFFSFFSSRYRLNLFYKCKLTSFVVVNMRILFKANFFSELRRVYKSRSVKISWRAKKKKTITKKKKCNETWCAFLSEKKIRFISNTNNTMNNKKTTLHLEDIYLKTKIRQRKISKWHSTFVIKITLLLF